MRKFNLQCKIKQCDIANKYDFSQYHYFVVRLKVIERIRTEIFEK